MAEGSFFSFIPQETSEKEQIDYRKIAVILPAYNEEVSIGSIVLLARKYADRVIVVDEGSTDMTAELAAIAGAEVIVHSSNIG